MSKNILVFFASLALVSHLVGCTSQGEKSEGGDEVSDVEALADESAPVTAAPTDAPAATSETLPEDALGAAPTDGAAAPNESVAALPPTDAAPAPAPAPVEGDGLSLEAPAPAPVDPAATVTDQQPPVSTEAAPSETASIEPPPAATEPPPAEAKPVASLQKVDEKPRTVDGLLLNGVYLARPGDNLKKISKMIYGEDRGKELKKANPALKFRGPKPGEKVYYHSVKRADDAERVVNFYEESGLAPETYTAKAGDNIRKVSKQLLGYDNAWKEVWSTNSVESKGELTEGTELKYFSPTQVAALKGTEAPAAAAEAAPAAPPAMNEATLPPPPEHHDQNAESLPPPPPPVESAPPPTQAELPPPPPVESAPATGTASSDLPPPPPSMDAAADLPPPPPEPQAAMNDIPPPPPPMEASPSASGSGRKKKAHDEGGMDEDTTMALGAVAVIAAGAAAMLVVRRKRKQKDMESNFDSTHVGT